MKIIIFGAAGEVGSRIVREALFRNYEVTAIVRKPEQFSLLPDDAIPREGDVGNAQEVIKLIEGQDVIVSAIRPPSGQEEKLVPLTGSILNAAKHFDIRVLVVGGAASLKLPNQNDLTVLAAPNFLPKEVINIARACFAQHEICKTAINTNWTYLSPPAILIPGIRTGSYRVGLEELVVDNDGISRISMEDFAVALLDEIQQPKHIKERFTVGY